MAQGFAIGSLVVTPTGRIALVVGEYDAGRLDLKYQDCAESDASVSLPAKLLKAANEAGQ